MPKHRSEENVSAALKETNEQIRSEEQKDPKGFKKFFSTLSIEGGKHPYLYLCVSLILFGFAPGLAILTSWIVILEPSSWHSKFYLFLTSQALAMPLAVSVWLLIADERTATRRGQFTKKFIVNFLKRYRDDRTIAMSSVEKGISSIAIRSSTFRALFGAVLVALLTNVVASSDFQNAFWELVVQLAATEVQWRGVGHAAYELWLKNALGVILLPTIPVFSFFYAKHYGIANSWLHSVKLELLEEQSMPPP